MRMRRVMGLALGLAAALTIGHFVVTGKTPQDLGKPIAKADEPKAKDEPELGKGKQAQEFIAAFDKGDAEAVAAFWTEDATYVDLDGRETKGRAAIEKLYEKVFAEQKGAKLAIHVTSVKLLTPAVGLEDGITEVTPAGGGLPSATAFSAVFLKKDGEWHIAEPP